MKTKLLALILIAGGTMFAKTRFSFGVNAGGYPYGGYPYYAPAPVYAPYAPMYRPVYPVYPRHYYRAPVLGPSFVFGFGGRGGGHHRGHGRHHR